MKRIWLGLVSLSFLFAISAQVVSAEEEENGMKQYFQDFFVSESCFVQDQREVQLSLAPGLWDDKTVQTTQFPLAFEYGITDRLQFGAEVPLLKLAVKAGVDANSGEEIAASEQSGLGDVAAELKYGIFNEENAALSAAVEVEFPTGDEEKGLGEGKTVYAPFLAYAHTIGKTQIHLSGGAELQENAMAEYFYGLGTLCPLGSYVPTLELNGTKGDEPSTLYLTPGFVWVVREGLELGIAVPLGLTDESTAYGVTTQFVWEFMM